MLLTKAWKTASSNWPSRAHCAILLDRRGRLPAGLVRPVRRDRVVHVADRAHPRQQRDVVAREGPTDSRVPSTFSWWWRQTSRAPFADAAGLGQHVASGLRMTAHHRVFGARQRARLVQDLERHRRPCRCRAPVPRGPPSRVVSGRQAELAGERDHQRAHRDAVHVRVVVAGLQAREADDRGGIAIDRFGDVLDERQAMLGVDALPSRTSRTSRFIAPRPCAGRSGRPLELVGERAGPRSDASSAEQSVRPIIVASAESSSTGVVDVESRASVSIQTSTMRLARSASSCFLSSTRNVFFQNG